MDKQKVIMEVSHILDTYCQDCFLRRHLRETFGKNHAQRFCINDCSVGDRLQQCGKYLTKD